MSDTDERTQGAVIAPVLGELERLRQEVAALRATAVPRPRRSPLGDASPRSSRRCGQFGVVTVGRS